MKTCSKCNRSLPLEKFQKRSVSLDGLQSRCRLCRKKIDRDRPKRGKENRWYYKNKERAYRNWLLKTYGLSEMEYDLLLAQQEHKCAICGGKPTRKHFDVDHDHKTGKVRGLLCNSCNRGLGLFKNNAEFLFVAFEYLLN